MPRKKGNSNTEMIIMGDEVSDALTTPIFYIKHINYQNKLFF